MNVSGDKRKRGELFLTPNREKENVIGQTPKPHLCLGEKERKTKREKEREIRDFRT